METAHAPGEDAQPADLANTGVVVMADMESARLADVSGLDFEIGRSGEPICAISEDPLGDLNWTTEGMVVIDLNEAVDQPFMVRDLTDEERAAVIDAIHDPSSYRPHLMPSSLLTDPPIDIYFGSPPCEPFAVDMNARIRSTVRMAPRAAHEPDKAALEAEWTRRADEQRALLAKLDGVTLDQIGGWCPVQAEGTVDGLVFYFRARGRGWEFRVAHDASHFYDKREIYALERHYGEWPDAGYMPDHEALQFIMEGIAAFRGYCAGCREGLRTAIAYHEAQIGEIDALQNAEGAITIIGPPGTTVRRCEHQAAIRALTTTLGDET